MKYFTNFSLLINRFIDRLVSLIYRTEKFRKKFHSIYPDEVVIVVSAAKAIQESSDKAVVSGRKWIFAKRSNVLLSSGRIVCGNWNIPLDTIEDAELVLLRSRPFTKHYRGQVLKLRTRLGQFFQFGMLIDKDWKDQNVLPLRITEHFLQYSALSVTLRITAIIGLSMYLIGEYLLCLSKFD
ncbi:hypothetical protein CH373_18140 [Leptospira perolatii]|uniref:Uncharacterized protein n=1 Tax=Leptospira perolatii TaxID=2023191 RepID=A0A2M9ZI73_9LEPT|nr:hypothetical protein [Leptospira perolatii]PJZ68059.1 hypothetical protein CH360_18110 [Leptospira perolatii]PJZ71711.1 hypothetical protein CH373_18140 [Leptospira perolatii]